jgi:hypothetical protein
MKKLLVLAALPILCFAAACNIFFSNNAGDEGGVTLSLGDGGAYTGVFEGNTAAFGDAPAGLPDLGDPRIVIYDASGKALRSSTFTGGSSSWNFSLPAGGPYWVDFSAPVQHPADPKKDEFPFVKSFGATVKVDKVEAGSNRDLFLPLRVRETAIMAPYTISNNEVPTNVWAPFYDLPAEYPEAGVNYISRRGVGDNNLNLDFDPYGGLLTTADDAKWLYRIKNLKDPFQEISKTSTSNVAFNLQDGELYISSETADDGKFRIGKVPANWLQGMLNWLSGLWLKGLSSSIFTVDEDGALYTIVDSKIYRTTLDDQFASFNIADIIDPTGQDWADGDPARKILDLKALNGYLYVLLYIQDEQDHYYDYIAAVSLDSIKKGTGRAAWAAGGRSVDELQGDNINPDSLEGFFGPKKIVGWGPDRIYVYDYQEYDSNPDKRFRRIVEVDIRNRRISRAGLVVRRR